MAAPAFGGVPRGTKGMAKSLACWTRVLLHMEQAVSSTDNDAPNSNHEAAREILRAGMAL
jgi:hypothetical protein